MKNVTQIYNKNNLINKVFLCRKKNITLYTTYYFSERITKIPYLYPCSAGGQERALFFRYEQF